MITYSDARQGAEYVRSEYEAGDSTSTIDYQLRLRYPAANGFERNRMIFRGVTLYNMQVAIRGGTPPLRIVAPFPFPPSTGTSTHPNDIRIIATALIETPGMPNKIRSMSAEGVSGDLYSGYADQFDAIMIFWQLVYAGSLVSVLDPARYIY